MRSSPSARSCSATPSTMPASHVLVYATCPTVLLPIDASSPISFLPTFAPSRPCPPSPCHRCHCCGSPCLRSIATTTVEASTLGVLFPTFARDISSVEDEHVGSAIEFLVLPTSIWVRISNADNLGPFQVSCKFLRNLSGISLLEQSVDAGYVTAVEVFYVLVL
ncbi:hypothetical protein ACP70R_001437 [Stipagrostis hirtigluma subsp. patula]